MTGSAFPIHVHRSEYLGAERLLYGEVGEAKAVARFPANAGITPRSGARPTTPCAAAT